MLQEKRKKEDHENPLSPKEYQLAKKRNKKIGSIRGQTPKQKKKTQAPPKKKQKIEEVGRKSPKKTSQPGNFKSKKKYEFGTLLTNVRRHKRR